MVSHVRGMTLALALALAAGCSLFAPRFSVTGWNPSEARVADPDGLRLWIRFSGAADRASVEQAYSLTKDGGAVGGEFAWDGDVMSFVPAERIERNHRYEITLGTGAEDDKGVSLDAEFHLDFSTRLEDGRPAVLAVVPAEGAALTDRYTRVLMTFSEAVDRASLYAAFGLSPSVRGRFDWSAGDSACAFVPLEPLAWQTEYALTLRDGLTDLSGNSVGQTWTSRFRVGDDSSPPSVLRASNAVDGVEESVVLPPALPSDAASASTGSWESTWGLALVFSERVEREGLESRIRVQPAWSYSIDDSAALASSFVLKPLERLSHGTLYSVTVGKGIKDAQGNATACESVFRFKVDGPATAPPVVSRLRFRDNPASAPASYDDKLCDHGDDFSALTVSVAEFPVGSPVETYVDLYITLAAGASVDLFSLMQEFSVEASNSCATFSMKRMLTSGFADPQPVAISGSSCVRVTFDLQNSCDSGIVTFKVGEGLVDSAGNPIAGAWRLPLLK